MDPQLHSKLLLADVFLQAKGFYEVSKWGGFKCVHTSCTYRTRFIETC